MYVQRAFHARCQSHPFSTPLPPLPRSTKSLSSFLDATYTSSLSQINATSYDHMVSECPARLAGSNHALPPGLSLNRISTSSPPLTELAEPIMSSCLRSSWRYPSRRPAREGCQLAGVRHSPPSRLFRAVGSEGRASALPVRSRRFEGWIGPFSTWIAAAAWPWLFSILGFVDGTVGSVQ